MSTMRTVTVRLPRTQAEAIKKAAETDGVSESEILRAAASLYIGERASRDAVFAASVKEIAQDAMAQNVAALREVLGDFQIPGTADPTATQ